MPRHTCEQRTICGTWFSPSSVSIWEMDSGHQARQQVLLPTLPSHWPPSLFLTVLLTLHCVLPFIFDNHFFLTMCSGQIPLYPWIYFICYYNTQTQRVPTDGRRWLVLISYTAFLVPSKRLSMTTSVEPLIIRLSLLWPLSFSLWHLLPHTGCFSLTLSSLLHSVTMHEEDVICQYIVSVLNTVSQVFLMVNNYYLMNKYAPILLTFNMPERNHKC